MTISVAFNLGDLVTPIVFGVGLVLFGWFGRRIFETRGRPPSTLESVLIKFLKILVLNRLGRVILVGLGLLVLLFIVVRIIPTSVQPNEKVEKQALGYGHARLDGPATVPIGSSRTVELTVWLKERARPENIVWRTLRPPDGRPIKASSVPGEVNLQRSEDPEVLIFRRMRAKLIPS